MATHKLARTTRVTRAEMVRNVVRGKMSVRAAADRFRVCRATVRKWVKRYRAEGRKGLETRTSAPVRRPRQTPPDVEKQIKELRLERKTGLRIAQELKLRRSTVGAVLRRLGMQRRPPLEPKKPLIRYEHKACGDLIHFDVKKLRQFDEPGRRYIDEGGKRKRGAKHDFVHACEDDYSRVADADVMHGEAATDCIDFLVRSIAVLQGKGRDRPPYPHRQRTGLPLQGVRRSRRETRHQTYLHRHPTPSDQRQGRALHPDYEQRVGLRKTLSELPRTQRCLTRLAPRV